MDVTSVSGLTGQQTLLQVGIAVTKKVMDVATANSQALIQMMERSVNPNLGGNIDIRI